jgi:branched-chain amino acid transport system ATP-binding protein
MTLNAPFSMEHNLIMLLNVTDLETGYKNKKVLFGVSLTLEEGEIISILGHNGAGKSTLLHAIFGLLPIYAGNVDFMSERITGRRIWDNATKGLVLVPGGHQVFGELSVIENLKIIKFTHKKGNFDSRLKEIFKIFPRIEERKNQKASTLSGGEQQMLAIAIGLLMEPKALALDEPSLGLAPLMVANIMETIQLINQEYNVGIVLVEQNIKYALRISSRAYVMRLGRVIAESSSSALLEQDSYVDLF